MTPGSRMLKIVAGIVLAGLAAFVGWGVGTYRESKFGTRLQEIQQGAQEGYLVDRFTRAFETQPPEVAIWEGTNLVNFLGVTTPPTGGRRTGVGFRMFLEARLSALFSEIGDVDEANVYADRARRSFSQIDPGSTLTSQQVVSNCLARDTAKRKYTPSFRASANNSATGEANHR